MSKNLLFIVVMLFLGQCAWAQGASDDKIPPLNTITTAVPFLIIAPDPRAGGMGDAGVATSADANSFHWNTSKLIFSKQTVELSASYSPWLRNLVGDIQVSYLAGYKKLNDRHVFGGSLRYFSLGNISFTDITGTPTSEFNPNEYEVLGGYALRLSDYMAVGINAKFVYSNLTGGVSNGSNTSNVGIAGATDLSFSYVNPDISVGAYRSVLSFGANISNIGNKVSYTDENQRDFLPANLKLGTGFKVNFDEYNSLGGTIDFNKLLVPTLPFRNPDDPDDIISGRNNDVGVVTGMLQSFYDAPGLYYQDENGDYQVEKGSRLKEELREINIGGGIEYWYSDILAFRAGYFHESASKGNRQYLTFGAGLKAYSFGLDLSYLVSTANQSNPLSNTVRFSLSFRFDNKSTSKSGDI